MLLLLPVGVLSVVDEGCIVVAFLSIVPIFINKGQWLLYPAFGIRYLPK